MRRNSVADSPGDCMRPRGPAGGLQSGVRHSSAIARTASGSLRTGIATTGDRRCLSATRRRSGQQRPGFPLETHRCSPAAHAHCSAGRTGFAIVPTHGASIDDRWPSYGLLLWLRPALVPAQNT